MKDAPVRFSMRLPAPLRRRFRILALEQGLTAQQALRQAVDAWMARAAGGDDVTAPPPRKGSSTGERATSGRKPPRRPSKTSAPPSGAAAQASASRPAKGDAPSWSVQALQLDWSQCPAAERVDTKQGKRWVFRGTRVRLADLFYNLERGHSVEEIVAHFKGLKDELVNNVMQFAGRRMYIPNL